MSYQFYLHKEYVRMKTATKTLNCIAKHTMDFLCCIFFKVHAEIIIITRKATKNYRIIL